MDLSSVASFVFPLLLTTPVLVWLYLSYIRNDAWSISIYSGNTPFELKPHPLAQGPVLSTNDVKDASASFVADPFMLKDDEKWYLFFEVLNEDSYKGNIAFATSRNGIDWTYEQIVLKEPFHLSYPYVFKWENEYYMIPESREASAVRLYKATDFPTGWTFVGNLLTGNFADPSVVRKDGKWWMFVLAGDDALALYSAEELTGPWVEHPASPVVKGDKHISRPGGRAIVIDDKILRYVQDCAPYYGNASRCFQVDVLTATEYSDHEVSKHPVLKGSGSGWNAQGMHHVDAHQLDDTTWIACVDGYRREVFFDARLGAKRFRDHAKRVIDAARRIKWQYSGTQRPSEKPDAIASNRMSKSPNRTTDIA